MTLGVPRLSEIINAAKNLKTPSLEIFLDADIATDKARAKQMQSTLELCNFKRLVTTSEIYYDPDPYRTVVAEDQDMLDVYMLMPDEELSILDSASSWVLRLVLSREMLVDRGDVSRTCSVVQQQCILYVKPCSRVVPCLFCCRFVHG